MENSFTAVFEKLDDWYIGYVQELPGAKVNSSNKFTIAVGFDPSTGSGHRFAQPTEWPGVERSRNSSTWYFFNQKSPNVQERTLEEARESLREAIELILISNRELAEQQISGKDVVREQITVKL